ncbi:MAG TPA: shikimate dehydrogenase [Longimicrobiales bacterium]|nr:shikimate dehydrogenase [Longimicrobiales bacterium]
MVQTLTAATRLFVLLGDPVGHSVSPLFQNAALRERGIDAVYTALGCDRQSVGPLIRALCRANGGGNVTIPHKAAAAECIERPSPQVTRTGACNTFWGEDGVVCGDNTDVEGFRHAASQLHPDLNGVRSLIIGAGGAAAAAACALIDSGAASITLINRSPDRARVLASRLDPDGRIVNVITSVHDVAGASFDLVVNASAAGLRDDDPVPFDLSTLARTGAAIDVVYRQSGSTPFVRHARRLGIRAADGTEMLIAQGASAFARWFGGEPPLDVMRNALRAEPPTPQN